MDKIVPKLKELIAERGILKSVLASKIGITKQSLYNMLGGNTAISIENLQKIAIALDVPITYFFDSTIPTSKRKTSENDNQIPLSHEMEELQHKFELLTIENKGLQKELESKDKMILLLESILKSQTTVLPEKKDWTAKIVEELEIHHHNSDSIPFLIMETKETGFLAMVKGIYAFIAYNHMPWKYNDYESWVAIAPILKEKIFFCKIHLIRKDPLKIILDGAIAQFKKAELVVGETYEGIVVKIVESGLFIDIGIHFEWRCGSLLGFLPRMYLGRSKPIHFNIRHAMNVVYNGLNVEGQLVFCKDMESYEWHLGAAKELIGLSTWAKVIRRQSSDKIEYYVQGKYRAMMINDNKMFGPKYRKRINRAIKDFKNEEIINCSVTGCLDKKMVLIINWLVEFDKYDTNDNTILNHLDTETLQKLKDIKNDTDE